MTVSMDQHMKAIEWLETHLEEKIFRFDVDEVRAMVEQLVAG